MFVFPTLWDLGTRKMTSSKAQPMAEAKSPGTTGAWRSQGCHRSPAVSSEDAMVPSASAYTAAAEKMRKQYKGRYSNYRMRTQHDVPHASRTHAVQDC